MIKINENYLKLPGSYLFSEIAKRVAGYQQANPDKEVIKMGIGDVTNPLSPEIIKGLKNAIDEMAEKAGFKGYGPEQGYAFLREAIADYDFKSRGVDISAGDIFISTGAKEDTANFQELFDTSVKIAVPDPVYPVYVDSNVMGGRTGKYVDGRYEGLSYLECTEENGFFPELPDSPVDLIYLCFPNNPTGQVATKEQLKKWVDYARENKALILFDAAYEAFVVDSSIPKSIFEIEGAKEVAVEFRSLSKTAGFTGTRLSYTIIPDEVMVYDSTGKAHQLKPLWNRRQTTKFNGTAYLIQKGAEAVFTEKGRSEINKLIEYYHNNAAIIRSGVDSLGLTYTGGVNSPYIWFKIPNGISSWDFFDKMLNECQVVGTPGSGFGKCGEGYFRLSAFGETGKIEKAISRLKQLSV